MSTLSLTPVVSSAWLAERLGSPAVVVLDASWYLPPTGRDARAEFLHGHIPGARYFDLDEASDSRVPLPHMLPPAEEFGAYLGGLGVGNADTVVVYDGSGANLSAARAWWMLRAFGHRQVAVLDGGLGRWRAEGRPFESGEATAEPRAFHARLDGSLVRTAAEVEAALESRAAQVVDLRSAGRFEGLEPEPRPGLPSGHMAGALNLPYTELVGPDGTVLPLEQLRQRMRQAGIDLDRPAIATCGSGVTACNLMLVFARLGRDGVVLYDGSWTEWAGSGRPMVTGKAVR